MAHGNTILFAVIIFSVISVSLEAIQPPETGGNGIIPPVGLPGRPLSPLAQPGVPNLPTPQLPVQARADTPSAVSALASQMQRAKLSARADEPAAAPAATTAAPAPAAPAPPAAPQQVALQPILGITGDVSAHLNLTVSVGRKRRAVEGWNDFAEHLVEDSDVIKSTKELSRK